MVRYEEGKIIVPKKSSLEDLKKFVVEFTKYMGNREDESI